MLQEWETGLFSLGDPQLCMYSFFCPYCALASARTHLDESMYLFNCCCLSLVPSRWLIRTAYRIPGTECHDILLSSLCPCCVINQLLQTAVIKGSPSPDSGHFMNTRKWVNSSTKFASNISLFCYVFFCVPCAVGSSLETSIGMPFLMGCCCVNPWAARNLIRYQYRIKGDDVLEECVIPAVLWGSCAYVFNFWPLIVPLAAIATVQLTKEVQTRSIKTRSSRYLDNVATAAAEDDDDSSAGGEAPSLDASFSKSEETMPFLRTTTAGAAASEAPIPEHFQRLALRISSASVDAVDPANVSVNTQIAQIGISGESRDSFSEDEGKPLHLVEFGTTDTRKITASRSKKELDGSAAKSSPDSHIPRAEAEEVSPRSARHAKYAVAAATVKETLSKKTKK